MTPRSRLAVFSSSLAFAFGTPDLTAQTTDARPPSPEKEEIVQLSPFEVTGANRGYYAPNTMSGTRLNSKLEDLASSISVITKEQMADFALLDINDIFLYEAGTEGTGTYTEFSFDRNGYPTDNTSLAPNSANRVRGISAANTALGNFATSGRVPIDPIDVEAVEISRGPNSSIFGLGSAGGTVNVVPASANLGRDRSQVQFRGDSYDGYRSSLDLNRVLRKDVLAVRASGVYQHTGYERKPSGTESVRLNGMIKFRPIKSTMVSASFSSYRTFGNMPNQTMPRDEISSWRNAGSPIWNDMTSRLEFNGVPSASTYSQSTLPLYVINTGGSGRTNSTMFIDGNGAVGYWGPVQTSNLIPGDNKAVFLVNTNSGVYTSNQPLFSGDPSLTARDKNIYDYTSINLAAMNYLSESTDTTNLGLEQLFFSTPRQMLALQLGYFAEKSQKYRRDLAGGPTSQKLVGGLYIDVNKFLPDGTANPDLLRPYIGLWNPRSFSAPLDYRTYRAQLAYKLDLRNEHTALRWLGMHQLSGYSEYKDNVSRSMTFDDSIISDHAWIPPGTQRGPNATAITNNYFRYYVGDSAGLNVDYGPHSYTWGQYPYRWGNALTGVVRTENATIGPTYYQGGGNSNNHQVLKTVGAVLQSYLINDRLVTTFGVREDRNYNRGGKIVLFLPDGIHVDMDSFNQWAAGDWSYGSGKTKTAGIVVKPLRWLSFQANSSDSFRPATPGQNLFLQQVRDPAGKGNDYGFTLNLFGGKLVARFNQYENKQIRTRDSQSNTLANRVLGLDLDTSNRSGTPFSLVPLATGWVQRAHPEFTPAQVTAQVAQIAQIDPVYITQDFGNTARLAETDNVTAKGQEIEVFYNASTFWTVKFNGTRQKSIDSGIAADITNWINLRLPVWQSIIDPETRQPWFTSLYGSSQSASSSLAGNVTAPLAIAQATVGKSRPQIRQYKWNLLTSYRLAGLTEQRILKNLQVGGGLRWEDKGAIGYYGVQQLPEVITTLDPNRPVYDKAHLYIDGFVTYRTRLFANKIGTTFQLNVRNLQEGGRLQPISAYPDGTPSGYRIIDPRQFILTATFDL